MELCNVIEPYGTLHFSPGQDYTAGGELWQNISAKIVHLISLYPTALTSTNHHFTVLCHPTYT